MTVSHPFSVLTFVETATFTKLIVGLVSDKDYADFQQELTASPEKGALLIGCGGVRKVRMATGVRGKSGGARVLYLYLNHLDTIYLLYLFTKGDAANLSDAGKKAMRYLAQEIKRRP